MDKSISKVLVLKIFKMQPNFKKSSLLFRLTINNFGSHFYQFLYRALVNYQHLLKVELIFQNDTNSKT